MAEDVDNRRARKASPITVEGLVLTGNVRKDGSVGGERCGLQWRRLETTVQAWI